MRVLLLLSLCACQPTTPTETITLQPGATFSRTIAHGRPHRFRFDLAADQFIHLTVEQRGIDVVVGLLDPSDNLLYETNGSNGGTGSEPVLAVTSVAGEYTLQVAPLADGTVNDGAESGFTLAVHEVRPAGSEERVQATTAGLLAQAESHFQEGDFAASAAAFRAALPGLEKQGETREAARAQWRLGLALGKTGALRDSATLLERSAARFRRLGDSTGEARVRNDLGTARRTLGQHGKALEEHGRALDLYRQAGKPSGEAESLQNIGDVLESTGAFQNAISHFEEALALRRQIGEKAGEALTLQRLGSLYGLIGHDAEGLIFLRKALVLREGETDARARISILVALAWAEYLAGNSAQALARYGQALELARASGDRLWEAGVLDRQGSALKELGRLDEAAASFRSSLEISRAAGIHHYQGLTLGNLGWLSLEKGHAEDLERARQNLGQAVDFLVESRDPNGEVYARVGLSRAERGLGFYGPARQQIEIAIRRVEELRTGLLGVENRGTFLATRYGAYEELVALLMDLERREPGHGHAREALEVAERARARNLLDQLAGGEGPANARQIQGLAADQTLVVVYLLAEPESFAWTVDRERIASHILPGRKKIEMLSRRLAEALPQSYKRTAREAAERAASNLAEAILTPLGDRLNGVSRLVILPDGALNLVAFAGLPAPPLPEEGSADGREGGRVKVLLDDHEIVLIPSATVLLRQREHLAGRPPAPEDLAVLADPIFSITDPRLRHGRQGTGTTDGRGDPALDFGPLTRLPFTATEAKAIARLVPEDKRLVVMGAAASRDLAMSGTLSRYRILHFATHGLLHPVLPERSGLVLSLVDSQGHPRDGFLTAPDVATLDLPADLVVLSSCRSGLGREMRGEGLVGLTQAFFRAGARGVIVSSWDVLDRPTADLMIRFYHHLLVDGLRPAAALRAAQLELREDGDTAAPAFWAGFTLHGDWR